MPNPEPEHISLAEFDIRMILMRDIHWRLGRMEDGGRGVIAGRFRGFNPLERIEVQSYGEEPKVNWRSKPNARPHTGNDPG